MAVLKGDENMSEKEMLKISIEAFSRVQRYMRLSDKNSEAYAEMKERYIELKIFLTVSGINLDRTWSHKRIIISPPAILQGGLTAMT